MIDRKRVFKLRGEGMSFRAIADALGTTKGVIAGLCFRKNGPARCIDKDCDEPRQRGKKFCHYHEEKEQERLRVALFGKK